MDQRGRWQTAFQLLLLVALFAMHAEAKKLDVTSDSRFTICNMCSSGKFRTNSVYSRAAFESVRQVVEGTNSSVPSYRATATYNDKTDIATVFAMGSCAPNLPAGRCGACLRYVSGLLFTTCGNVFGGRYLTTDCYLRYEAYPFEEPGAGRTDAGEPCTLSNPRPKRRLTKLNIR